MRKFSLGLMRGGESIAQSRAPSGGPTGGLRVGKPTQSQPPRDTPTCSFGFLFGLGNPFGFLWGNGGRRGAGEQTLLLTLSRKAESPIREA